MKKGRNVAVTKVCDVTVCLVDFFFSVFNQDEYEKLFLQVCKQKRLNCIEKKNYIMWAGGGILCIFKNLYFLKILSFKSENE